MTLPRVVHVAQPVDGGVGAYVAAAALAQQRAGWDVAVACPERGELPDALRRTGVRHLGWESSRQPGPSVLRETRALRALLRDQAPTVVHLHSSKAGLVGRLALRGRVPTLFQPHGWSWLAASGPIATASTAWERWGARWSDQTVCVSDGERQVGRDAGVSGVLSVVRNGVDVAAFATGDGDRERARTALGLPLEGLVVVALGRASRQKGHDRLLSAWREIHAVVPDALLVIAGDGPDLSTLRAASGPGVLLLGATNEPARVLAAADLVVFASRWEGLSLALLEALAAGRPVLTTAVSGSEVVPDNCGGVLPVDPLDDDAVIRALVPAVLARLQQPDRAHAEGQRAATHAREHLDVSATWQRLSEVTLEAAARQG